LLVKRLHGTSATIFHGELTRFDAAIVEFHLGSVMLYSRSPRAEQRLKDLRGQMERTTGFEPVTLTLANRSSRLSDQDDFIYSQVRVSIVSASVHPVGLNSAC
jgi:hypothetical protein